MSLSIVPAVWASLGEISPVQQNVKVFVNFMTVLFFSIGQQFEESTLANLECDWANFQCCNRPNMLK